MKYSPTAVTIHVSLSLTTRISSFVIDFFFHYCAVKTIIEKIIRFYFVIDKDALSYKIVTH